MSGRLCLDRGSLLFPLCDATRSPASHRRCRGEGRYIHQPVCSCPCHERSRVKRRKPCAHTREDLTAGRAPCSADCSALPPLEVPA